MNAKCLYEKSEVCDVYKDDEARKSYELYRLSTVAVSHLMQL